jgi:hypothetical protein
VVLDLSGIAISRTEDYQDSPAVAFDGTNSLVVWNERRRPGHGPSGVYGTRVSQSGAVLESTGIALRAPADVRCSPKAVFGSESFLVAWDEESYGSGLDLYAARVTQDGAVLDTNSIAVSTAPYDQHAPALGFDGTCFLLVWMDNRCGTEWDLYGAQVTPAGVVFDSGPVVRQERDQLYPALARGPGNQMFLAYQGWAGTVGGKAYNVDRIWGKMNPVPGVEEGTPSSDRRPRSRATVVRGVLYLPPASSVKRDASSVLLDISGRMVMDLRPGPNSTAGLAPGVYFVRGRVDTETRRVVLLP